MVNLSVGMKVGPMVDRKVASMVDQLAASLVDLMVDLSEQQWVGQ